MMITKLIAGGTALPLLAGCTTAHADRTQADRDRLRPFTGKWNGTLVCDKKPGAFTLDLTIESNNLAGELIYTPGKVMSSKTSYTGKARVKGGLDGVKRLWIDAHG